MTLNNDGVPKRMDATRLSSTSEGLTESATTTAENGINAVAAPAFNLDNYLKLVKRKLW